MERKKTPVGPFRATRLWNSLVSDFSSYMPTKRHRWKMKFYENCFTAGDAVDWLHDYLQKNENYGPWVTRQQAVQLLEKFHQNKIIMVFKGTLQEEKDSIDDNSCLFRIAPTSPIRKIRSALHSRSNLGSLTPSPRKRSVSRRSTLKPLSLNAQLVDLPKSDKDNENLAVKPRDGPVKRRNSLFSIDTKATKQKHRLSAPNLHFNLEKCDEGNNDVEFQNVEDIWKSFTLKRLQRLLNISTLELLVDLSCVDAKYIIHNSTHFSKSGVVTLTDKSQDLPHWVISAMKCLAQWPQRQDQDLPTYTGFERDVFSTISNYFQSLPEPLIPCYMYNLIIEAYVLTRFQDAEGSKVFDSSLHTSNSVNKSKTSIPRESQARGRTQTRPGLYSQRYQQRTVSRAASSERVFCITKSKSVSALPAECSQPVSDVSKNQNKSSFKIASKVGRAQSVRSDRDIQVPRFSPEKRCSVAYDNQLIGFLNNGRPRSIAGCLHELTDNDNVFTSGVEMPYLHPAVLEVPSAKFESENEVLRPKKHRSSLKGLFSSRLFGSTSELFNKLVHRKGSKESLHPLGSVPDIVASTLHKQETVVMSNPLYGESSSSLPSRTPPYMPGDHHTPPSEGTIRKPNQYPPPMRATYLFKDASTSASPAPSHSTPIQDMSSSTTCTGNDLERKNETPLKAIQNSNHSEGSLLTSILDNLTPTSVFQPSSKYLGSYNAMTSTPVPLPEITVSVPPRKPSSSSLQANGSDEIESCRKEALKFCSLMLPPPNRRKLHLLLKLMNRVQSNVELELGQSVSKRTLLLQTFSRCILKSAREADFDEVRAMDVAAYLMDHYDVILCPSEELKADVQEKINCQRKPQIMLNVASQPLQPVSHCQQVSVEEFEQQKISESNKAMEDLLETIINGKEMPAKEKKKKLKLFQSAYPDIYAKRLPTTAREAQLFPQRPKIKQPMLKSLSKLKPIR